MTEIAVIVVPHAKTRRDDEGEHIHGLIHIATVESALNLYVWCWGETARNAWTESFDPANCLQCIAHGPRKPWKQNDAGILVREGPMRMEYDLETTPDILHVDARPKK